MRARARGGTRRAVALRLFGRPSWATRDATPPADDVGQALVARWHRGDPAAFSDIFKTYRGLVHGVLSHLLRSDPELEDVVQTAFIEIFRSLPTFEGRSKLSSWMARVALHVGYHHLRRRKSRPPDYKAIRELPELVDETPRANPHDALEQKDAIDRVHAILETIAPKKRTIFILNDLQGLGQEEVAEIVGANIATVRTRLFYARKEFWKKAAKDPVLGRLGPDGGVRAGVKGPPSAVDDGSELTAGGDGPEDAAPGAPE